MRLLDQIAVRRGNRESYIELFHGDLTDLKEHSVDILVVSAFPDNYVPTRGSLIGALYRKGLSVEELAKSKEADFRKSSDCWLSVPIVPAIAGLCFRQILCFEPRQSYTAPQAVGNIFRCLVPAVSNEGSSSVAMPVVASGDQGVSRTTMLSEILDSAVAWMSHGLPLNRLKIVIRSEEHIQELTATFAAMKTNYAATQSPPVPADFDYDAFISYSHSDKDTVEFITDEIKRLHPTMRVFVDRPEIPAGAQWYRAIFEGLDRSRRVIAVLSPAYVHSNYCQDEYSGARIRANDSRREVLFPIYILTAPLPTSMKLVKFEDCREVDQTKLREACRRFVESIAG